MSEDVHFVKVVQMCQCYALAYTYIRTHTRTHAHTHAHTHTRTHARTRAHEHTHISYGNKHTGKRVKVIELKESFTE